MKFKIDYQSNTLVDQVEESILDYIKRNKLVPGDSLPNEMALTTEIGVSRNVLREALSRLRMLGIIQSRTNRGIIIQEPSLFTGFEKVIEPHLLSESTIIELMKLRIVLEIGLTDLLFKHLNDNYISELERIVLSHEAVNYNLTLEQETEFHNKLYQITGSEFLISFQKIIHPVFVYAKNNYDNYFAPTNERLRAEKKLITHKDLFNLIKARDMEGYRMAIKLHLATYSDFIEKKTEK
ncbi:DNA-binding transcriptional regulator, FadR family [Kriegella aquimaris]|uniref:DNA-binding transcriptional regulator, FadR family n=2 Tax=Kriegella aquimaris TaxID=192904 RepID=A0A1G9VCQ2_9FLAO|nr:DNA-binding transcriptional regulator, FadR family [Kriegella aquimaris]